MSNLNRSAIVDDIHCKREVNMDKIVLPYIETASRGLSVEQAIEKRRSIRDFSGKQISKHDLSRLLHYAYGITNGRLRSAPSAGALYPIDIYPVVNNISGINQGIYRYLVNDHSLELIKEGDFRDQMVVAALGQEVIERANVVFVMTAIPSRSEWKYLERTNRYIFLEAGHIAQNLYLEATFIGLGSCAVGAFSDSAFNHMLGIDGIEEFTVYAMAVGY